MLWRAILISIAFSGSLVAATPISSIKLERTVCFGSCPVYSVTISSDGRVQYDGKQFVKEKGTRVRTISAVEFQRLAAKADEIGFFDLQSKYTATVTDLPTTIVTITRGDQTKRVEDYFGAPNELHELEQLIAGTVKPWVDLDGKPPR